MRFVRPRNAVSFLQIKTANLAFLQGSRRFRCQRWDIIIVSHYMTDTALLIGSALFYRTLFRKLQASTRFHNTIYLYNFLKITYICAIHTLLFPNTGTKSRYSFYSFRLCRMVFIHRNEIISRCTVFKIQPVFPEPSSLLYSILLVSCQFPCCFFPHLNYSPL